MVKVTVVQVALAQQGQRIDNFLINRLKGVPKSRVYKAIRSGEVRVNKGRVKQTHRLVAGDQIRIPPIHLSERKTLLPPSQRWLDTLQQQIVIARDDVLLINKPAGMPVHAGSGIERGLIENIKASPTYGTQWELVHRLDRETSGLLVLAKRGSALQALQDAFRERLVRKSYFLWVKGTWVGGERAVEMPLRRELGGNGERRVVVDSVNGRQAKTVFSPLIVGLDCSLLLAQPETGRTHQIRVHAASMGYPILGDTKYGNDWANQWVKKHVSSRLFLHSASLCFPGHWSQLNCCTLPDDRWLKLKRWLIDRG